MTRILNCRKLLFASFFTLFSQIVVAQLTTNSDVTPEQAVDILTGNGVVISNLEFSGGSEQIGSFNCEDCGLGLEDGLVLVTGDVSLVEGPNDSANETVGGVYLEASDTDLELLENSELHDAAVLEFDFVATSDSISFEFVFGSEEYPEYVNSINDVFGFFLSGPGIEGPFSNDGINIALIPGTDTPVSISTVNNGEDGTTGPCVNCEFYINNGPDSPSSNSIQFDGFTTVMEADAGGLQCGETYHIKLAIADNYDAAYDSGIFLKGNSLSSGIPDLTNITDPLENSTLIEGCSYINFPVYNNETNQNDTIFISTGGTSVNGIDYSGILDFVVLDASTCVDVVTIEPLDDMVSEETETLFIQVWNEDSTGGVDTLFNAEFNILDYVPPSFVLEESVSFCSEGDVELTPTITSGIGVYDFQWSNGDTSLSTIVSPLQEMDFVFSMMDQCGGQETSSVTVTPINIETFLTQEANTLTSIESDADYQWLDCNNSMQPIEGETNQSFVATENGSYAVTITLDGCTVVSECYDISGVVVDEIREQTSSKIYPNPTTGDITLECGTQIKDYLLVDFTGRVIQKGQVKFGKSHLNLFLPESPGVYCLRVNSGDGSYEVHRIVKK